MPRRTGGAVHVATIKTRYKDREYVSQILRRSYREGGKVKHENLGNVSHLPAATLEVLRRSLAGETLLGATDAFEVLRSLPHGHVAAVLGVLRGLDLERLICRERCRERDLCVAMVCQRLLAPCSKLSTRLVHQSTLAQELELGEVKEAELLAAMGWLLERQERIERSLARRHLQDGFVLYDLSSSYLEGRCCELGAIGYSRDVSVERCRSPTVCAAHRRVGRSRSRCTRGAGGATRERLCGRERPERRRDSVTAREARVDP